MARHVPASLLAAATVLVFGLTACTSPTPPPPPPPPPPPVPETRVTASGVAYALSDTGERRPVPNLRLKVRFSSAADGTDLADVVTDGAGRYTLADVSPGPYFFQTAPGSSYRFLCDWSGITARRLRAGPSPPPSNDLVVVPADWSGDRPPPGMWILGTNVWGTVSERTPAGSQPVAGATVVLEEGWPDPPATTSARGFYMICSQMGANRERVITVSKDGYTSVSRTFYGDFDWVFHFEITRK